MSHCVRSPYVTCAICKQKVERNQLKQVHLPECRRKRDQKDNNNNNNNNHNKGKEKEKEVVVEEEQSR